MYCPNVMKIALKSMPKQTLMKMSHEDHFLFDKKFFTYEAKKSTKNLRESVHSPHILD